VTRKEHQYLTVTPEVQRIVTAWAEIMKATLSPARVAAHLAMLEQWEQEKAKILEKAKC
jgi:hypothetical protein